MDKKLVNNYEVLLAILEVIKNIANNTDNSNTKLLEDINDKIEELLVLPTDLDDKIEKVIQILQNLLNKEEINYINNIYKNYNVQVNNVYNKNYNVQVNNISNILINNILQKHKFQINNSTQPDSNSNIIINKETSTPSIEHIEEMLKLRYENYCYKGGLSRQCCKPNCNKCTLATKCIRDKQTLLQKDLKKLENYKNLKLRPFEIVESLNLKNYY